MNSPSSLNNEFLTRLTEIVEANLNNQQFGVSMLAKEMGMSRSNLHRRVNEITRITVSQFINQVRLKKAKEILRHTTNTVSEVAYEVGFNNVSYFIKRFHEYYGYSPGEVGNRSEAPELLDSSKHSKKQIRNILIAVLSVIALAVTLYIVSQSFQTKSDNLEKSIAVLLPYYHISDSSNYIIDGIAEAVYSKLQLVGDLTVRPWTSVIKYRDSGKGIPEIAEELKVNYIIEFICQNFSDNKFNITVSLINVTLNSTTPLGNFNGTIDDIDTIEKELSNEVAQEIDANITPEETIRMKKVPTTNITARKYYLLGLQKQNTDAESAISFFEKAVEEDNNFALAYAELADTYSLLDTGINAGKFTNVINNYADKAILLDNENDKCLIAKAKVLQSHYNFELAINYLEKAVEYNPNSAVAYRLIARWTIIGGTGLVNPKMCIENAFKSVKYNLLEEDADVKALDYRYLARGLRTAGFYKEAFKYMDIAINFDPENYDLIAEYCEIIIDSLGNYNKAINMLKEKLSTAPLDYYLNLYLLKDYFHIGDYQNAFRYYNAMVSNLNYQPNLREISRLAVIYNNLGMQEKGDSCIKILENIKNIENLDKYSKAEGMIRIYCHKNDISNALEQLKTLSHYKYQFSNRIRLLKDEPTFENLRQQPEFQQIISNMEDKFAKQKEQIRKSMVEKGLM